MKRHVIFMLLFLSVVITAFISACGSNSPSAPSKNPPAPTPTFTQACWVGTSPTCTPTFTYTSTNLPTPTGTWFGCPFPSTMGNISGALSGYPSGYLITESFTLTGAGVITALKTSLTNATGNVEMAVYSDCSGVPCSLLGNTNSQSAVTGVNNLALTTPLSLQPGNYWIAVQTQNGTNLNYSSGGGTVDYRLYTFGSFPASLPILGGPKLPIK